MSTSPIKRRISRFHVVVVQWTLKKYSKKRDHVQSWGNLPTLDIFSELE